MTPVAFEGKDFVRFLGSDPPDVGEGMCTGCGLAMRTAAMLFFG